MAGVGHLEGTSLPVGGTSTHCVLTAHSGMRNLSMFDDIHSLEPGDLVLLHTMNKDARLQDGGLRGRAARGDGVADHRARRRQGDARHLHAPWRERPSPAGALRAYQVQQEATSTSKSRWPAGRHWGKRVCRAHRGCSHLLLLLDIVVHDPQTSQKAKQGLGIGSSEPPQWGTGTFVVVGSNHHNIR